jgi:hypothetical protein
MGLGIQGVSISTASSIDVQEKEIAFFLQSWRKQLDGLQAHFHSENNYSNLPKSQESHI